MKNIIVLIFVLCNLNAVAQKRNNTWCFGDSAGVDFNAPAPVPFTTALNSRGSCASISDTSGQLLFYAGEDDDVYSVAGPPFSNGELFNKMHTTMHNGDSIIMALWYMECLIVGNPTTANQYYVFTTGVTGNYGLYYNLIDMTLDSGLGAVIQKNIQLLPDESNDGLTAIKHGNGRDWWIIHREFLGSNNTFYKFLITPSGISVPDTQNIGSLTATNTCRYIFNKTGDKLAMVMYGGLIETFDFDRCSGLLSNHVLIRPKNTGPPAPELVSCEFSPNSNYLYVSTGGFSDSIRLIQIDLMDTTLYNGADTVWTDTNNMSTTAGGFLRRGPDDKIYFSCAWDTSGFTFPYSDSAFNAVNTHLSVINQPDSLAAACMFTPFSFYLGGGRTYYGLPNNPDYDMKPLYGSVCDSLSAGIESPPTPKGGEMFVTYISEWDKLFVNAQNIKGKNAVLKIYDLNGRVVFSSAKKTQPPYYTIDVDVSKLSYGMYVVSLSTEREVMNKKFVKN